MYLYSIDFQNGKRYIGIAVDPVRRWAVHKSKSRALGKLFPVHAALRKHGMENVTFNVLVKGDELYIRELERKAIEKFKTRESRYGYNLALGGEMSPVAGIGHTIESRAKMSIAQKKRVRSPEEIAKMSTSLKGRIMTSEHCSNLSKAAIKRYETEPFPNEAKKKISTANRKFNAYSYLKTKKPRAETLAVMQTVGEAVGKGLTDMEISQTLGISSQYVGRLRKLWEQFKPLLTEE